VRVAAPTASALTASAAVLGLALALALAAGCGDGGARLDSPDGGGAVCDLGAHVWQQTSPGSCNTSTWRFTKIAGGSWSAVETGCANATGTATYSGGTVTLTYQYTNDDGTTSTGAYTWPLDDACVGSPGSVRWDTGPLAGQSSTSTLSIAP